MPIAISNIDEPFTFARLGTAEKRVLTNHLKLVHRNELTAEDREKLEFHKYREDLHRHVFGITPRAPEGTLESRLRHHEQTGVLSTNQKNAIMALDDAMRNLGGHVMLTDDPKESNMHFLPAIFQSETENIASHDYREISMHFDAEFDDVSNGEIRGDDNVIDSQLIGQLRKHIATTIGKSIDDIVILSATKDPGLTLRSRICDFNPEVGIPSLQGQFPGGQFNCLMSDDAKKAKPILKISPSDFDSRGDIRFPGGNPDFKRGTFRYVQPSEHWTRVGLTVLGGRYSGNDDWLAMNGNANEWAVGFHGTKGPGREGIAKSRQFKTDGGGQMYAKNEDVNPRYKGKTRLVGNGAYFSEDIEVGACDRYSAEVDFGGVPSYLSFQTRLHPVEMRIPANKKDYRVITETQYARPYGVCFKNR